MRPNVELQEFLILSATMTIQQASYKVTEQIIRFTAWL